jgi:hypothetical protein
VVRLLRFGERGGGSARREKLFGRDAETCGMYGWLRDNGLPEGGRILVLSCNESKGMGERCTLAHIDRKDSQSNEENRNMPKSDMIGTEGEITAVHRGGVRHAEV